MEMSDKARRWTGGTLVALLALTLAPNNSPAQGRKGPTIVDGDILHDVLPRDAISAIDSPRFVSRSEAQRFMEDEELVIGVYHDGVAKAYSTWFLDRHEIVNDVVAGVPIAVTW